MHLVDSKKINEEELQELFPEGLYKCFRLLYPLFIDVCVDADEINCCCSVTSVVLFCDRVRQHKFR